MMYLGSLGRLVAIKCPTSQRVAPAERYTFRTTLGGAVKAQAGPVGRRTWDVNLGSLTTPSDVAALTGFSDGSWGAGPFVFVSADAPVVNLLSPGAASCDPAFIEVGPEGQLLGSPPMRLGNGQFAARGVWKATTDSAALGDPVPVLPGVPVTGSAWVIGVGFVRMTFVDSVGTQVQAVQSERPGTTEPTRLSVTATPPATAVAVQLWVSPLVTHAARPAVTWTDQPYEWGDGQGCDKAVIEGVTRDLTKAWDDPRTGRWSELSFTVREVG